MKNTIRNRWPGFLLCAMAGGVLLNVQRAKADGVPDNLQQMYDVGQYRPLVAGLNAAIAKTPASDNANRYPLLIMKGEALLHLKASSSAQDAFTAASLVGPDDNSTAIAKATAYLIRHSGSGRYQPKTKAGDSTEPPAAIDILDQTSRKQAFVAFFTDLLAVLTPKVDKADEFTTLTPIMTLGRQVADARNVEIAGTGADAQSKPLLDKLATQAGTILTAALKPLDAEIKAAEKDATRRQRQLGRHAPKDDSVSLSPEDADELDSAVDQARQVVDAVTQMLPIFGDAGDLKTVQGDAQKVIDDANKILTQYQHSPE